MIGRRAKAEANGKPGKGTTCSHGNGHAERAVSAGSAWRCELCGRGSVEPGASAGGSFGRSDALIWYSTVEVTRGSWDLNENSFAVYESLQTPAP